MPGFNNLLVNIACCANVYTTRIGWLISVLSVLSFDKKIFCCPLKVNKDNYIRPRHLRIIRSNVLFNGRAELVEKKRLLVNLTLQTILQFFFLSTAML